MIRKNGPRILTVLVSVLAFSLCANAQGQPGKAVDTVVKVGQFLKKAPYKVEVVAKGLWSLKAGPKTSFVTAENDYVIAFSILARKGEFKATAESLAAMLKYAGEADFIKIIMDESGDLVLRIESKTKGMDQKDFDAMIDQVFAATDGAIAKLSPFLVK